MPSIVAVRGSIAAESPIDWNTRMTSPSKCDARGRWYTSSSRSKISAVSPW